MKPNRYFWRFALVLTLLFWGTFLNTPMILGAGVSLVLFWSIRRLINSRAYPHHRLPYTIFLTILCLLFPVSFIQFFALLFGFSGMLWAGYAITSRFNPQSKQAKLAYKQKQHLTKPTATKAKPQGQIAPIIAELKAEIKELDQAIKTLNHYRDQHDLSHYKNLAEQILLRLRAARTALTEYRDQLDDPTYDRLIKRIDRESQIINRQLHDYGLEEAQADQLDLLAEVHELAPELLTTVSAVQKDSQTILRLIRSSKSGNQAELLELHETNIRRFSNILDGYLKIKASPNYYYDADQRLETARATMAAFENNLKEQVRQLNENDMHEFEVNLRLLNNYK